MASAFIASANASDTESVCLPVSMEAMAFTSDGKRERREKRRRRGLRQRNRPGPPPRLRRLAAAEVLFGYQLFELAVAHQFFVTGDQQILGFHALELAQGIGQRAFEQRGHLLAVPMGAAQGFVDNLVD